MHRRGYFTTYIAKNKQIICNKLPANMNVLKLYRCFGKFPNLITNCSKNDLCRICQCQKWQIKYLFSESFSSTLHKVTSQTSDETHGEVSPAPYLTEVRQTVHNNSDQTSIHHEVILRKSNNLYCQSVNKQTNTKNCFQIQPLSEEQKHERNFKIININVTYRRRCLLRALPLSKLAGKTKQMRM